MKTKWRKISIYLPQVSENAEFPILFLLLFLPSYLNQTSMPPALFDHPAYQLQILYQSLLIFMLTLYLLKRNAPPSETGRTPMTPEINILECLAVLAGLAVLFLLYNLILRIIQELGLGTKPEEPVLITRGVMLLPAFILCLCASLMEEFFFRGYAFFRMVQSGMGMVPALLLTNMLFAAGHFYEGVPAAVFAFASGIFLSLAMRKGVSLFSLSAAHGIFNFTMILISYFR